MARLNPVTRDQGLWRAAVRLMQLDLEGDRRESAPRV